MPNVSSLVSKAKGLYGTAKGKLDGVKNTIKKVSPAGAVTGAGIGYFTGGLEGTRKSQLDAYNEGVKDGIQKRAANLAASAKKIAKVVGSGAAAGGCPAAGVPAAGADAGGAGGPWPERSGPGGQLHQLQPADAGCAADDRPVPAGDGCQQQERLNGFESRTMTGRLPAPAGAGKLAFFPIRPAHEPEKAQRQARALLPLHLRNPVPV